MGGPPSTIDRVVYLAATVDSLLLLLPIFLYKIGRTRAANGVCFVGLVGRRQPPCPGARNAISRSHPMPPAPIAAHHHPPLPSSSLRITLPSASWVVRVL